MGTKKKKKKKLIHMRFLQTTGLGSLVSNLYADPPFFITIYYPTTILPLPSKSLQTPSPSNSFQTPPLSLPLAFPAPSISLRTSHTTPPFHPLYRTPHFSSINSVGMVLFLPSWVDLAPPAMVCSVFRDKSWDGYIKWVIHSLKSLGYWFLDHRGKTPWVLLYRFSTVFWWIWILDSRHLLTFVFEIQFDEPMGKQTGLTIRTSTRAFLTQGPDLTRLEDNLRTLLRVPLHNLWDKNSTLLTCVLTVTKMMLQPYLSTNCFHTRFINQLGYFTGYRVTVGNLHLTTKATVNRLFEVFYTTILGGLKFSNSTMGYGFCSVASSHVNLLFLSGLCSLYQTILMNTNFMDHTQSPTAVCKSFVGITVLCLTLLAVGFLLVGLHITEMLEGFYNRDNKLLHEDHLVYTSLVRKGVSAYSQVFSVYVFCVFVFLVIVYCCFWCVLMFCIVCCVLFLVEFIPSLQWSWQKHLLDFKLGATEDKVTVFLGFPLASTGAHGLQHWVRDKGFSSDHIYRWSAAIISLKSAMQHWWCVLVTWLDSWTVFCDFSFRTFLFTLATIRSICAKVSYGFDVILDSCLLYLSHDRYTPLYI